MHTAQKTVLIGLLLIFLSFSVNALNYSVGSQEINIQIATEGNDKVIERFEIIFPNEQEKINFRETSLLLGTNIDDWKNFNAKFTPSLGLSTLNKKISYNEGEQNYLEISYDLSETLMAKGKETTMVTEYTLKISFFNSFYQAGLWIIPDNTTITVELPAGAEIRETIEPQANISLSGARRTVSWQGYQSGNRLTLKYILWKKIDPVVDLNALTAFLFKTQEGMILMLVLIAGLALIAWKRKGIARTIEEFVEKNSIIREE